MKTFDWNHAAKIHPQPWWEWLKNNHDKTISVEAYELAYRGNREADKRSKKAKHYYHKKIVGQYNGLKEKFGFFV